MKDTRKFSLVCILILGIQRPVNVKLRPGKSWNDLEVGLTAGLYQDLDGKHKIEAVIGSTRGCWKTLLAHEFVHAWMAENHPCAKDHGRTFQRACSSLRKALRDWGFYVSPLYIKGVDV